MFTYYFNPCNYCFNTVKLHNISNKQSKNYLNDVSTQIVMNVDSKIKFILSDLRIMADFIKQYEGDSRYEYLSKERLVISIMMLE